MTYKDLDEGIWNKTLESRRWSNRTCRSFCNFACITDCDIDLKDIVYDKN